MMDSILTLQRAGLLLAIIGLLWRFISSIRNRRYLSFVPGPERASWWKGNFSQFINRDGWQWHEDLCRKYGGVARVEMPFGIQQLYVSDPLALQHICVKDQQSFDETELFLTQFSLLFGRCLLSCVGETHKKMRKMLNPVFSHNHIKNLFPVFVPIAMRVRDIVEKEVRSGAQYVDLTNWTSRAALEYIGQGGLGYSFNALDEKETRNKYSEAIKTLTPLLFRLMFARLLVPLLVKIGPPSFRRWVLQFSPPGAVQELTDVVNQIESSTTGILREKKKALDAGDAVVHDQVGKGKDILSILLKTHLESNGEKGGDGMPEHELIAHMSSFIIAGHETTSSGMSKMLDVLAKHPAEQQRLRDEIRLARAEHDLDHDTLTTLPFLDAVVRETLRLYPPAMFLDRACTQDTILPLAVPELSADGKTLIKEIPLKKGTTLYISVLGANRDKHVWGDDADEWKPERWLRPLPRSVQDSKLPGIYSQMMTFLGGARSCIGFKFAEMELKLVTALLVEKFKLEPGPEIFWAMGNVQLPMIAGSEDRRLQLPLKVTLVDP